jgi:ABC-2 type transport system permease protein
MIGTILLFELQNRLGRISTYIYFTILLLWAYFLTIASGGAFSSIQVGLATDGKVMVNSPFALYIFIGQLSLYGLIITAALAGQATYQDIDNNCAEFFYTAPISKLDYLAGRFLGSLATQIIIFAGLGAGAWLGVHMPFLDHTRIGPERFAAYVQPYLTTVIPNLIFLTAIFFALAALGRKMLPVYAGSVLLLIGYLFAAQLLADPTRNVLFALADPLGSAPIARLTQYWTPYERNTQLIPLSGIFLWNRLLWLGMGALLWVFTYYKFSRSHVASRGKRLPQAEETQAPILQPLPRVNTVFSFKASLFRMFALTWLQFMETVKNVFFFVILLAGLALAILIGSEVANPLSTPSYPVTSRVVTLVVAGFTLFVLVLIIFYSGELVWREREAKVSQIIDALPARRWVMFGSKLGALMLVQVVVMCAILAAGLMVQAAKGYYHFELGIYFKELFLIQLVRWWILCALGLLIHTLVNQKYFGYFMMVFYYIIMIGTSIAGWQNYLYRFGQVPAYTYSDMNGYGPFVKSLLWFEIYWVLAAVVIVIVTNMFWVRGMETGGKQRLKLAWQRLTPAARAGLAAFGLLFLATGGYIYYNTGIINQYRSANESAEARAQYEKKYRQYKDLPLPRITDVQAAVDLYPEQRSATVQGTMWLENKTPQNIDRVALTLPAKGPGVTIRELSFAGGQTPVVSDPDLGFYIYRLSSALPPGGRVALKFGLQFDNKGFANSNVDTRIVENGTFISVQYLPFIGYSSAGELGDDSTRHKHGLDNIKRMAKLEDVSARQNNYIRSDSDWVNYEATISTSPDQIAITPGYLQKEWMQDGRRYFHYKMDAPILDFFTFNSARYQVLRDKWNDVNLEIYYHPGHEFDLDRMQQSMKTTLAYCSTNFSPFQFHQLRVIEFPRYAAFAQSFANTIPFSEGIGFIMRVDSRKPDAIDFPFYVTAHEVAHQWWGHQEIAANVEGATSLVETLAQYTALMVMKHRYGPEAMKKFLHYELANYLLQRALERNEEKPLERVEAAQGYIHYQKGGLVMYALQDYIGEDKVDQALSDLVKTYAFKAAPYPTSLDLVERLRKVTPPEYQSLIDDLFEHITLYESRAQSATYSKQPDGKFRVHLVTAFKKYRADSRGEQREVPANDWIDIGVLDSNGQYLYLQKHKIDHSTMDIDLTVDKIPAQAGIDPLNKLIDRRPDDNLTKIVAAQ